jgi:hypothetical protein
MPVLYGATVHVHIGLWGLMFLFAFGCGLAFSWGLSGIRAYRHERRVRRMESGRRRARRRRH